MKIEGKLAKWNDERGFGFILPRNGGQEVFAHISAFPANDEHPKLGEVVSFEIEIDKSGKKRAIEISYPSRSKSRRYTQYKPERSYKNRGLISRLMPALLVGFAVYGYAQYLEKTNDIVIQTSSEDVTTERLIERTAPITSGNYKCDGRIYCSQMSSCAEATFFLKNCPGVHMDGGQSNGIPCESQWCPG